MKTKKIYLLAIYLLFAANQLFAQQGAVAAGGTVSGSGGSMAYSIGQTDYLYFYSENGNLSFGLQQTWFANTLPLLHDIAFPAGWSSLSSYLMPASPTLEDVFAPIAGELIIAQTLNGFYFPGENINTIGNWPQHAAIMIKTSESCTLPVSGIAEQNKTIMLASGWNLMPVVAEYEIDVADLFGPLGNLVAIVKEVAGYGIFWPGMGINTIGVLQPGRAYLVKVAEDVTVEFPE